MASLSFKESAPLSVGVELELQLVNTHNYNLASDAGDLLRRVKPQQHAGELKPEITQSMVEVNSSVHERHGALVDELKATRDVLSAQARKMNVAIAGGGTHPFQKWSERRIFPTDRFLSVSEKYGFLAKQFTVFGQHIHIGCANADDALYLCHSLTRFLPQFVALSASSPFYQGADTAFDSSRLSVVNAFPLSGTLPFAHTWDDFCAYFDKMAGFGIVKSMKDFYWDIRPKPEYGTVEIRVCDTPLTVEHAADLAAYAQALAGFLLDHRDGRVSAETYLVHSYNRFQACRFGLAGQVVDPATSEQRTISEDIAATVRAIEPYGETLGSSAALARLNAIAVRSENDASWLRAMFAKHETLTDVVRAQAERWMGS